MISDAVANRAVRSFPVIVAVHLERFILVLAQSVKYEITTCTKRVDWCVNSIQLIEEKKTFLKSMIRYRLFSFQLINKSPHTRIPC
jgi:hypothetical protein